MFQCRCFWCRLLWNVDREQGISANEYLCPRCGVLALTIIRVQSPKKEK